MSRTLFLTLAAAVALAVGATATLFPAALLASKGTGAHVEMVLVELAGSGQPPAIADISGHGWLEIDEPHERDHAEAVLAREPWWQAELGPA